jgi:hypothetical protein
MKMRLQGNAIRFRLNRREVSDFDEVGKVGSSVAFPGGRRLTYELEKGSGVSIQASFDGDAIRVRVPERVVREWAEGDEVGIHDRQSLPGGGELEIVIEKDFQCMHKGEEAKDPEAYPNPMALPLN